MAAPTMTTDERNAVSFTPIKGGERIAALDALRGLAIFGILFVNASYFGLPMMETVQPDLDPALEAGGSAPNWFAAWFVKTFFEMKFISMFSMMFGISAALQFDRARRSGSNFDGFYLRRLLILLGFGVLHAVAFFYGDVLTIYALLGLSLLIFCRLKTAILLPIIVGLMTISAFLTTGMMLLESLAPDTESAQTTGQATRTGWDAIMNSGFQPQSSVYIDAETIAHQEGPYLDLLIFRTLAWFMALFTGVLTYGWHIMGMFALGVVIKRSAFFTGNGAGARLRFWMMLLLPLGLLIEGLAAWVHLTETDSVWNEVLLILAREFSTVVVMLGYAATLVTLVNMNVASVLFGWLAKVGRMALTNYLLESLIMTTIFEYYGFGLFGKMSRVDLILASAVICVILTVFSVLWLRWFSRGPMEWLWRMLAYMRRPALKRG
ncbi:MAG: hypothetical protein CMJ33_10345 [Phycisphaerae bacterium]|nr:hypothetical protein [Phycisphaerae bacterium]